MKVSDHYPNVNTQGLWRETLEWLGVARCYLTGKNCPCPFCGGADRFRWLDNDRTNRRQGQGIWICNQCQERTGNGFEFIKRYRNASFSEAVEIRKRALEEIGYDGQNKGFKIHPQRLLFGDSEK